MIPQTAELHYQQQRRIAAQSVAEVRALWAQTGNDLDASWLPNQSAAVSALSRGQVAAAAEASAYVPAVLRETAQADLAVGEVAPAMFGRYSADGRSLDTLMYSGVTATKAAIKRGYGVNAALLVGGAVLDRIVFSEITRAGSGAAQVGITARLNLTGYVRMVSPGACKDCLILAGKWFRWNEGFERHPFCNCRHIPAPEAMDGDFSTDPYAYFNSLTEAEQNKLLGEVGAQTVRDGGDIYRVVNVQNRGLGVGRQAHRYGTPMKLTPEQIYARQLPREQTLRLLRDEGYVTGPQTAGGNIIGRYREAYQKPISRPVIPGSKRDRVLRARESGVRDPLDRATMTAAERRLFDANYRLEYAKKYGYLPRSIGQNSADIYSGLVGRRVTPEIMARLEGSVQLNLARIRISAPNYRQMRVLSESLGLTADAFTSRTVFDQIEKRVGLAAIGRTGSRKVSRPPTASGGGAGRVPPRKPPPAPFGDPPDPADKDAYKRYWRARQDALPLNRIADNLDAHEVEFYEQFLAAGNRVRLIPKATRLRSGKTPSTNDFFWVNRGVNVELKSFDPAKWSKVTKTISSTVASAQVWGVTKDHYIIYGRRHSRPPKNLLSQLRSYNAEHPATQIKGLFWWDGATLTEIRLS